MAGVSETRRRLSPDDRRNELLALGAKVFGERPYDEVRIDEIAERAGVSRALMYHYFPDKRAFFAAVVKAEGDRLFEATNTPPLAGQTLFEQLREGVLAYLHYDESHPHGAWAAYVGMGTLRPRSARHRGHRQRASDQPASWTGSTRRSAAAWTPRWNATSASRCTAGWPITMEMCRQRIIDPSIDAGQIADTCAHALLDVVGRVPGVPAELTEAVAARATRYMRTCRWLLARWLV